MARRTNATPLGKPGGYKKDPVDTEDGIQGEFKNKGKQSKGKEPFGPKKKTVRGFASLPMKTYKQGDKQGV